MALVGYGCVLVSQHALLPGGLIKFALYASFVGSAMGSFPDLYANVQKAVGASERVLEILDENGEDVSIHDQDNVIVQKITGELAFENVVFAYPSRAELTVLNDISFEAERGQRVAIVGPSGSGKSTMAALILQFYHPQSGTISFDGKPANNYSLTAVSYTHLDVYKRQCLFCFFFQLFFNFFHKNEVDRLFRGRNNRKNVIELGNSDQACYGII